MLERGDTRYRRPRAQVFEVKGPERAAGLAFSFYGAVWVWYLKIGRERLHFAIKAWYPIKATPSFADALA
ncbi:MAG: hypothetical protein M0008_04895 [Actinomycetota bacterium]|nr:hypothetical protein [Actinomycetota bacterium]